MNKYRSIDASWEEDEYIYLDDNGEYHPYYFNNVKYFAYAKIMDVLGEYRFLDKIIEAEKWKGKTGLYSATCFETHYYYWVENGCLRKAHNKPEKVSVSGASYSITFPKNLQKLSIISGIMADGVANSAFNLRYCHSEQYWDFDLHSSGDLRISNHPGGKLMTIDQKKTLPNWFLKCKKSYSEYVQIVEEIFASLPIN